MPEDLLGQLNVLIRGIEVIQERLYYCADASEYDTWRALTIAERPETETVLPHLDPRLSGEGFEIVRTEWLRALNARLEEIRVLAVMTEVYPEAARRIMSPCPPPDRLTH